MGGFPLFAVLVVALLCCKCAQGDQNFDLQGLYLLSQNKPAVQSSNYNYVGYVVPASKANDGNYNQMFGTTPSQFCSHTQAEVHPWWRVDLQGQFHIQVLHIWNRKDCCSERLFPFRVETSRDGIEWDICAEVADSNGLGSDFFVPCKARGRFVRVMGMKSTPEYLTLCEVEVWGGKQIDQDSDGCEVVEHLLSRNKPALQSSNYVHLGYVVSPQRANDGDYSQIFGSTPDKFCSHTQSELHPWWRVDLGGVYHLTRVRIWNRQDCCGDRLLPLIVETSLDGMHWDKCGGIGGVGSNGAIYGVSCEAKGRYVRVTIMKPTPEYLTICEIEVWGGHRQCCPVNEKLLSRNKPAQQSSDYVHLGYVVSPQRANDGYYSQVFGSTPDKFCSHTKSELHPWWKVDLGAEYELTRVRIWNRQDCCGDRLLPLKVETSLDGVIWVKCADKSGVGMNGAIYAIPCVARGRYVRVTITKPMPEYLTICEIEVWGGHRECCPSADEKMVSRNKPAKQSSNYIHLGYVVSAQRANDGYYSQIFGSTPDKFCSHTMSELHPWWRVDLGAVYDLTQVRIWNRQDCCGDRLLPLKVETSLNGYVWEKCADLGGVGVNGGIYGIPCKEWGRYVRVTITKPTPEYLTICEIEVWAHSSVRACCADGGVLLSRNKPAQQSTNYVHLGYVVSAQRGNDGNYNQVFGSIPSQFCSHTALQYNPWWKVDLQGVFNIDRVRIWNRADCCGDRLLPLKIETSVNNNNWHQCASLAGTGENGKVYTVPCVATARYVRVTITKLQMEYLTICELEVWGCNNNSK